MAARKPTGAPRAVMGLAAARWCCSGQKRFIKSCLSCRQDTLETEVEALRLENHRVLPLHARNAPLLEEGAEADSCDCAQAGVSNVILHDTLLCTDMRVEMRSYYGGPPLLHYWLRLPCLFTR